MEAALFDVFKGCCAAFIAVICLCRAAKMDNRVRALPRWIFVVMGTTCVGLALSPLMERWMLHACIVGFMASVCALLIEGEARWKDGIPDELLMPQFRYPYMERRKGDRRGVKPADGEDGKQPPKSP